jgi:hypothetical protein
MYTCDMVSDIVSDMVSDNTASDRCGSDNGALIWSDNPGCDNWILAILQVALTMMALTSMAPGHVALIVLATGPGNPPAVRVWTAKTGWFRSRTGLKPDPQTLGGPNPDPYPSTRGFHRVWLDRSVPISGSAFRVSHLWSHSDMRLLIVKYWPWYGTVRFRRISRLDVENRNTQAPNYILKMSVNRASTIFGLASSVLWVVRDHKHP